MVKLLYKKECDDCSIQAENEVLDGILNELREITGCPEKVDIIKHTRELVKGLTKPIKNNTKQDLNDWL